MTNIDVDKSKQYLCFNCGEAIYFGHADRPIGSYARHDSSWNYESWKHVETQSAACKQMWATPSNVIIEVPTND